MIAQDNIRNHSVDRSSIPHVARRSLQPGGFNRRAGATGTCHPGNAEWAPQHSTAITRSLLPVLRVPTRSDMQDARVAPRSYARRMRDGPAKPKRRGGAAVSAAPAGSTTDRTLVDAFKQHGMKLCDGSRLNAVGKGIHAIGSVPPTLAASVSALYLSQNSLRSLEGIEQFHCVRLLSLGGNLLTRFEELDRLAALRHLRNLNLVGNPLCEQPNYRLLVVDRLTSLQVLDAADISKKERDAAPAVATHDRAMRKTLIKSHFEIYKLQRMAQLIEVHKDFCGLVFTGAQHGRFDRIPAPHDVMLDLEQFLRLWDIEEAFSIHARAALEQQMLAIVTRTYRKLAEHPKNRAKEYLASLAGAQVTPDMRRLGCGQAGTGRNYTAWDEAYGSVISLQQQTIINLRGICEHKNRDAVEFMKDLLVADAAKRSAIAQSISRMSARPLRNEMPAARVTGPNDQANGSVATASAQLRLPPQQEDPDELQRDLDGDQCTESSPGIVEKKAAKFQHDTSSVSVSKSVSATRGKLAIRSGEFANQTLGEAIQRFSLRDSSQTSSRSNHTMETGPVKLQTTNLVFALQLQQGKKSVFDLECGASPRKDSLGKARSRLKQLEPPTTTMLFPVYTTRRRESHASTIDGECSSPFGNDSDAMSVAATSDATSTTWEARDASTTSGQRNSKPVTPRITREYPSLPDTQRSRQPRTAAIRAIPPLEEEDKSSDLTAGVRRSPPPPPPPPPSSSSESIPPARLLELEQREEKYIKALMESEQRELELRNGLCALRKKLTYYQRTFRQDLEERQRIKQEVEARVMTVAAPKILRRFFMRWMSFHNWTLQVHHIRRKRTFIVKYDFFWLWRRSIWLQNQLKELGRRRRKRELWSMFGEWADATRLSVIATRSREHQALRALRRAFATWKYEITVSKFLQRKQEQFLRERLQQLSRRCWEEWRRTVHQRRKVAELNRLRSLETARSLQQVTLWKWKVYVLAVARPVLARADLLLSQRIVKAQRRNFRAWWRICKAVKAQRSCLIRRVWSKWTAGYLAAKSNRADEQKQHRARVRQHFLAWRCTSVDKLTSRRALALAKRYVNQRRQRKLWLHWKFFSITRKKHRQDSTKALKHYFMKLLRHSWRRWKTETRQNLQSIKRTKMRTLRQHFQAFAMGIRHTKIERFQRTMVRHVVKRRSFKLTTMCFSSWRCYSIKRKWTVQCGKLLQRQNSLLALGQSWRTWRSRRVQHLVREKSEFQGSRDKLVDEKNEMEADLMVADDQILSIQSEKEDLAKQLQEQANQLGELERSVKSAKQVSERQQIEHAKEIDKLEQLCREWEQRCSLEASKHEGTAAQFGTIEKENQELRDRVSDLEQSLAAEQKSSKEAHVQRNKLCDEMNEMKRKLELEASSEGEKVKVLEQDLSALRSQLAQEQKEREETANRLQEYERRIASTCEAINQHEDEHERDKMRLRCEYAQIEAKWREEHTRNAELQRLLVEKNELIQTLQISQARGIEPQQGNHSACDAPVKPASRPERDLSRIRRVSDHRQSVSEPPAILHSQLVKPISASPDSSPVDVLLKEISSSPLLTSGDADSSIDRSDQPNRRRVRETEDAGVSRSRPQSSHRSCSQYSVRSNQITRTEELVALEQERLIDERTSKVHDDIRLLQERIAKRLEQGALSVSKLMAYRQHVHPLESPKSILPTPSSSLSDNDGSSATESASCSQLTKAKAQRKRGKLSTLPLHRTIAGDTAPATAQQQRPGRENASDSANAALTTTKSRAKSTRKSASASSRRCSSLTTSTLAASSRKKKNCK